MLQKPGTCPEMLAVLTAPPLVADPGPAPAGGAGMSWGDGETCEISGADAASEALMSTTDTSVSPSEGWCRAREKIRESTRPAPHSAHAQCPGCTLTGEHHPPSANIIAIIAIINVIIMQNNKCCCHA
uniref:Uncharacterized protein n=1 Tax=Anopheles atroparvus TaxID=41427 RepID=A0A182J5W3_ANOAO